MIKVLTTQPPLSSRPRPQAQCPSPWALRALTWSSVLTVKLLKFCLRASRSSRSWESRQGRMWVGKNKLSVSTNSPHPPRPLLPLPHTQSCHLSLPSPGHPLWDVITQTTTSNRMLRLEESRRRRNPEQSRCKSLGVGGSPAREGVRSSRSGPI